MMVLLNLELLIKKNPDLGLISTSLITLKDGTVLEMFTLNEDLENSISLEKFFSKDILGFISLQFLLNRRMVIRSLNSFMKECSS
jgi:hypothetical protein